MPPPPPPPHMPHVQSYKMHFFTQAFSLLLLQWKWINMCTDIQKEFHNYYFGQNSGCNHFIIAHFLERDNRLCTSVYIWSMVLFVVGRLVLWRYICCQCKLNLSALGGVLGSFWSHLSYVDDRSLAVLSWLSTFLWFRLLLRARLRLRICKFVSD